MEWQIAQLTALFVNSKQGKGATLKKPDDFMIKSFWKNEAEQDIDVIKKAFGLK